MALTGAITGGLFDVFAGREANRANLEAARLNRATSQEQQDKALGALTGSDPFQATTREGEGFKTTFGPAGTQAAETRNIQTLGDIGRARSVEDALAGFKFNVPTLADARGIVSRDQALQAGEFAKGVGDITKQATRQFGGIQNTGANAATIDALRRFSEANRFGGEREALDLLGKSNLADIGTLQQIIAANQAQGPRAPGFETPNVGPQASNVISSIRPAAIPVDLASTLPFAAGSSVIKQMQQAEQTDRILEALQNRGLAQQGVI